jgi:predicted RND superfamily exporter protein
LLNDQLILMPGVLLVLVVALFATFRSIHGILLPLGAVTVALVWTLGVFAIFGRPVDIIGSVIPTTLLVYGVVDPIFVLTRYLLKLDMGRSKEDAIVESMSELVLPCALTSFTTALGFAAFATATLPTIRYFGIAVAVGVTFALVTTLTVLPLLLAVTPAPTVRFTALRSSQRLDAILQAVWAGIRGRLWTVMAAVVVLFAVGGWLVREQHIVNVYVRALPRGDALEGATLLEKKLSGVVRIIVYLEGEADVMKRPEVVKAIDAVDRFAEQQPGVTSSVSLADLIAEENQAFAGGDPAEHKVPASRSLIAQYLAIVDPQDRSEFVSDDFAKSHIPILVEDVGSEKLADLRDKIERETERAFAGLPVKASMTGNGVIVYKECDQIVIEVLYGFITAFSIIVLLEWLMLRSLRIALISIVPNAVPVLVCFLTMKILRLDLRIDNSLVLCISVGGLFNTTIHLAARILQRLRAGESNPDAIVEHSMRLIGPPSFLTAAILSLGFAVLIFSSFPGLQALGVLSMVTLMTGFVSDMVITPVMMRLFYGWKRAIEGASNAAQPALMPVSGNGQR